jgi:hypothetical protein
VVYRAIRLICLLSAVALLSHAQTSGIDKLSFLSGCWTADGTEEMWTKPAGGSMMGLSRTVKGNRTLFTEFVHISAATDGTLIFNVQLKLAGKSTQFRATELKDGAVTFSNPEHDYPQRIMYRREPDGSLFARIEGTTGGKNRHEEYKYKRARCSD